MRSEFETHSIDTGIIYSDTIYNWDKYPREIIPEMENILKSILVSNNLISVHYSKEKADFFKKKYLRLERLIEREFSNDINNSPATHYFLIPSRTSQRGLETNIDLFEQLSHEIIDSSDLPSTDLIFENDLYDYKTSFLITSENGSPENFEFFFALKLSQIDILSIDKFLEHQLNQIKTKDFKRFTELLLRKYKSFLSIDITTTVFEWLNKIYIPKTDVIEQKGQEKEFTTARQVLAIHYLMEELNVYRNTDKTEIARFIQFLTGKETGASKINDTTIYKRVKSPLSKNDKSLESDLQFIRTYFEKLGLNSITDRINKEINSKE